jgi:hypothetical protein
MAGEGDKRLGGEWEERWESQNLAGVDMGRVRGWWLKCVHESGEANVCCVLRAGFPFG